MVLDLCSLFGSWSFSRGSPLDLHRDLGDRETWSNVWARTVEHRPLSSRNREQVTSEQSKSGSERTLELGFVISKDQGRHRVPYCSQGFLSRLWSITV